MIDACIVSVGVFGPGLPDWSSARGVLGGQSDFVPGEVEPPLPECLGPRERRRTSFGVRLALAVAGEAVRNAAEEAANLPTVFAWAHGDGPVMQRLLETLATPERFVSPTEFHNSVHNVAVGYWTIASGSHLPCSSVAAGIDTFPAGMLKALAEVDSENRRALLIVCGVPFPEPLNAVCPVAESFGAAFVLGPADDPDAIVRVAATYTAAESGDTTRTGVKGLEALWETNAAARALPLLECVASRKSGKISIPYGKPGRLRMRIEPC